MLPDLSMEKPITKISFLMWIYFFLSLPSVTRIRRNFLNFLNSLQKSKIYLPPTTLKVEISVKTVLFHEFFVYLDPKIGNFNMKIAKISIEFSNFWLISGNSSYFISIENRLQFKIGNFHKISTCFRKNLWKFILCYSHRKST